MTTDFDLPLFATPDQIRRREFVATRRGYDPDQVRAYLEQLADQIAQLEARVAEERKKAEVASNAPSPKAEEYERATRRIAEAIRSADESAERILTEARAEAGAMLDAARAEADRVRAEAQATADAALGEVEKTVRETREVATRATEALAQRRDVILDGLVEMQERLVRAAGDLEAVIRLRGESLPPLPELPEIPTAPGIAEPRSAAGAVAPAVPAEEVSAVDPAYADLWGDDGGVDLEVPSIPKIDVSWDDLDDAN